MKWKRQTKRAKDQSIVNTDPGYDLYVRVDYDEGERRPEGPSEGVCGKSGESRMKHP